MRVSLRVPRKSWSPTKTYALAHDTSCQRITIFLYKYAVGNGVIPCRNVLGIKFTQGLYVLLPFERLLCFHS